MGNGITSDLTGDKSYNISAEKIEELSEQIRNVDYSMCGFVKSLDSLRVACELFLRQCDRRHDKTNDKGNLTNSQVSKDEWETVLTDEELAVNLMKTLEESVSDQMRPAVESLAKLLKSLINTGKDMIDESKRSVTDCTELSLDMYLSKGKDEENENPTMTFTAERIQGLRKQLQLEKELNEKYKKDIEQLVKRDKLTRKEINILREANIKMEKLKEEKAQLEQEYELLQTKLRDDSATDNEKKTNMIRTETKTIVLPNQFITETGRASNKENFRKLKDEYDNMKKELDWFHRKQYIQVQVLSCANASTPIDAIMDTVETKLEALAFKLKVHKLNTYKPIEDMNLDVPILIFINAPGNLISNASDSLDKMKGFKKRHIIVLVVVHRESKAKYIRKSREILLSESFKQLGGIFDVVHEFTSGFHDCDMNETSFQGLSDFVYKEGVRKSVVEAFDLIIDH